MYILIPTSAPIPQIAPTIISSIESSGGFIVLLFLTSLKNYIISSYLLYFLWVVMNARTGIKI